MAAASLPSTSLAGHPVPHGLVGQGRCRGLLGQGHGNGEAVVLHEEDDRGPPDGREVQRLVEITLAGAAVADHGESHHVVPLEPRRVGQAHGVRQLGGERGAQGRDAVLARVVPGVPVAAQQGQGIDRVQSPRHRGERVAVAGEEPVPLLQHQGGRDLAGLLPGARRIDGEPSLLGEGGRLCVVPSAAHELRVEPQQQLGVCLGRGVRTEHAVRLGVREQGRGIGERLPGRGRRGPVGGRAGQLLDRHDKHLLASRGIERHLAASGVPAAEGC